MNQDNELPQMLLNDEQLEQLDELLEVFYSEEEDADLFVTLGYLTAQALQPAEFDVANWLKQLISKPVEGAKGEQLTELLTLAATAARQGFYQGGGVELPFDLEMATEDDENELADWCAGFMQAVFEKEEAWFAANEHAIAELLIPIMALSGLFADEEEFIEIEEDPQLMEQLAKQLPDLLLDIYCQINAPEEKPKTKPLVGKLKKNRRR
ncbi:MAG: YecA family protein [Pseudomonadaceae bacterium]|nr:YecA family protein [Pseudomonadaceae bacterium]